MFFTYLNYFLPWLKYNPMGHLNAKLSNRPNKFKAQKHFLAPIKNRHHSIMHGAGLILAGSR
ncbi:hypothetical protein HMPREF1564_0028 [Providencia alcalifaciens R90-1475]|nr:hypothetical protein HMPREF1564_0028 [Providencia alcalifaciens R90-1475]